MSAGRFESRGEPRSVFAFVACCKSNTLSLTDQVFSSRSPRLFAALRERISQSIPSATS
jgi:hypothetical protein